MLKERRRLVFVVRETPLSLIHLRNMAALTEAGAVILPASPSFYAAPQGVEELCGTVADRAAGIARASMMIARMNGRKIGNSGFFS